MTSARPGPLAAVLLLLAGCTGSGPLREEPLRAVSATAVVDSHLALVRRHAPWLYHAVDAEKGRQDLPTRVDFDGDLRGGNNWDAMARFELPPIVYYAVVTTETHWFISYHVFHPRDWACVRIGLNETHENDGENLQVVVERATDRVVLLYTQAHYFGAVHAPADVLAGDEEVTAPLLLLDDAGRPTPDGPHPAVFVESSGHGILGALDPAAGLAVDAAGRASLDDEALLLVLRPAAQGEAVREPALPPSAPVAYALESTTAALWPGVRDGRLQGEGGLFDGAVPLERPPLRVLVPRFYEGDRFSGVFGSDRGISPFALCFSFLTSDVGDLFFDPAGAWLDAVTVPGPWSRIYVDYPFGPAPASRATVR